MKPEDIEQRYTKGQTIVERGSRERVLYVVRSGNVLVHITEGQAPYLLGPGDMFGEAPAILGRASPVRAEAEGDTSVLALDVSLLNVLVRENAEFSFRLIQALAERVGAAREEASAEALPAEPEPPRTTIRQDARALSALARAILARRIPGEVPTPVRGRLMDLAAASHLPIRQAYLCLQELLDRRLVGLVDDQLTVLEPDELASVAQKPA
ncbi:MAG TPA: cyclic nucleotide-binding domain-containing protein [Myxococcota bacterium]|nr:cyclic nucleotide-binding domain-containing protein [Myxococcota bacterium]